jgi:hypothetical protein
MYDDIRKIWNRYLIPIEMALWLEEYSRRSLRKSNDGGTL